MRKIVLLLLLLASACGIQKMFPEGPVRTAMIPLVKQVEVNYKGDPLVDFPVIPLQVFAATYDLDLVLVSEHPNWDMHEFALVKTPEGEFWMVKDAKKPDLEQTIISDHPEIEFWLPEIPLSRKNFPIVVNDQSDGKWLDLKFEYENWDGDLIKASYVGKYPNKKRPKRNGSTMGHSKNQVIAVLDLPTLNFAKKSSISYAGKNYKIKKIGGLVPFEMALSQTQGGLSVGTFSQSNKSGTIQSGHQMISLVLQDWEEVTSDKGIVLSQTNSFRSIFYHFNKNYELTKARVRQWNSEINAFEIYFEPPLPDFRRLFEGTITSTFRMNVNGQENHAVGEIRSFWTAEGAELNVQPLAPWWVADRPIKSKIKYSDETVEVEIVRTDK